MMAQVAHDNVTGLLSGKQMGPICREAGLTAVRGRKKGKTYQSLLGKSEHDLFASDQCNAFDHQGPLSI